MTDNEIPKRKDGTLMVRFETRTTIGKGGILEKKIFIGGEELDWSINQTDLLEARKMGPVFFKAIQMDIAKHFAESVSDFLGRRVTIKDIQKASKTGWL